MHRSLSQKRSLKPIQNPQNGIEYKHTNKGIHMKKLIAVLTLSVVLTGCSLTPDTNAFYPQEDGYCVTSSIYGCLAAVYNNRLVTGSVDLQPNKLSRGHLTSASRVYITTPDDVHYDANGSYGETISVSTNSAGGINTTPLAQQSRTL